MGDTGFEAAGPFSADLNPLFAPSRDWNVSPPNIADYLPEQIDPTQSEGGRVMDIVNILRGDSGNSDGSGGGVNFDPSRAATNLTFAEEAAGFTPGAGDRAIGSLQQSAVDALRGNAVKMSLMNQLGAQVNPGDLLNPQGLLTAIPNAMMAAAGVETPDTGWGSLIEGLPAGIASLAGLNPVVGTAAGLVGPVMADALGDYFGFREADKLRDQLEDASGQLRGRRQYRSLMDQYDVGNKSVLESEGVNTWGDAANVAQERINTWAGRRQPNIDELQNQINQRNAYETAQKLIEFSDREREKRRQAGWDHLGGNDWRDTNPYDYGRGGNSDGSGGNPGGTVGGSGGDRQSSPGGMGGV
jgi:hypothetical protein